MSLCANRALMRRSKEHCYSITSSARASTVAGTSRHDQFVLGRRLHGEVAGLLALKNAIDITCRASLLVEEVRPIADQAASGDEQAIGVDCGQSVSGGERDDLIAMKHRQRTSRHYQAGIG